MIVNQGRYNARDRQGLSYKYRDMCVTGSLDLIKNTAQESRDLAKSQSSFLKTSFLDRQKVREEYSIFTSMDYLSLPLLCRDMCVTDSMRPDHEHCSGPGT